MTHRRWHRESTEYFGVKGNRMILKAIHTQVFHSPRGINRDYSIWNICSPYLKMNFAFSFRPAMKDGQLTWNIHKSIDGTTLTFFPFKESFDQIEATISVFLTMLISSEIFLHPTKSRKRDVGPFSFNQRRKGTQLGELWQRWCQEEKLHPEEKSFALTGNRQGFTCSRQSAELLFYVGVESKGK